MYRLLDLSVNLEVKWNAKTKIFSLFMDWIGDDMSQIKLIEYQTMHQTGIIELHACCPLYGHLDLSVDRERRA